MEAENLTESKVGWIEAIVGCMFSGKTEELIRLIKRVAIAKQKYQIFKPKTDIRSGENKIESHSGFEVGAIEVDAKAPEHIVFDTKKDTQVVAIDEAQFFSEALVGVVVHLANSGKRVIVAGLELNFRGEPYVPMPDIMALAKKVTKLTAICKVCQGEATRSQRFVNGDPAPYDSPVTLVGGQESYSAVCGRHHIVPGKPNPFKRSI